MTTEKKYWQDGDVLREYTAAEYAQFDLDAANDLAAKQTYEAEVAKAATDKAALLTRLGLTADEFKTLLGGN